MKCNQNVISYHNFLNFPLLHAMFSNKSSIIFIFRKYSLEVLCVLRNNKNILPFPLFSAGIYLTKFVSFLLNPGRSNLVQL